MPTLVATADPKDPASEPAIEAARTALLGKFGDSETDRIDRGISQVTSYWRSEDGSAEALSQFLQEEFLPRGEELDQTFDRLEFMWERAGGYFTSLNRDLRRGADLEIGPFLAIDRRLAGYDPSAHLKADLFANKTAFVALLNFPATRLEDRLQGGTQWSRRQWAEARLTDRFLPRVPAEVEQEVALASATADSYINAYNIYMHHLLTEDGRRPFPKGLRLISHWGLRDELKAHYAGTDRDTGLEKQQMIQKVMDHIVRQEIPAAVVNNPLLDWSPTSNRVEVSTVKDAEAPAGSSATPSAAREDDERYRQWLEVFRAQRKADPHHPLNPSHIERRFNVDREIPEDRVRGLFEALLTSPLAEPVGQLVSQRLGRPLEPFDIWYVGFKPRGQHDESSLDALTQDRYPKVEAFSADLPRILTDLGFSVERAQFLTRHIEVEPSRGAGHAFGASRRDDKAHLRTRIGENGMDYKGYNIAVHELGHNVEQVFSVTTIDHTLLQGVPNTAFTEALAFVFQNRDLELLGLHSAGPEAAHLKALNDFWATREIAGVGLVDMNVWSWLYQHPEASPAQLRAAVVTIAQDVWNRYFAKTFGKRDQTLLAIYSHMIDGAMYTPDYPLGHLIAFQIERYFENPQVDFGKEFERICQLGQLTPEAWMRQAVGAPLSAEPLLEAAAEALEALGEADESPNRDIR
ncbi:MAG: hypothetical protein K0U98_18200 [Deltaproteobacteria bacterium]|nr:hypothetical protein [Deltaproteobacteria bacterium]